MNNLAAPEPHQNLNAVACFQKFYDVFLLEIIIMLADYRRKPDLFLPYRALFLTRLAFLLFLLILIFVKIDDAAYRRCCLGYNFHQIKFCILRPCQRLLPLDNANLITCLVNQPYFWSVNLVVYSDKPFLWPAAKSLGNYIPPPKGLLNNKIDFLEPQI